MAIFTTQRDHVMQSYDPPQHPFIDVLYTDSDLLVLNKQSGLLSVPGKLEEHNDCLEARACATYDDPLLVHRLDMETSGVFIMARNRNAQRSLGQQFEKRKTHKTYVARVVGEMPSLEGTVDLPLICDWPNRPKQMVDHENGKNAITHWRVLDLEQKNNTAISRVELTPETGRSHQLRVHMLALGHVIVGDHLYGDAITTGMANRLQLHAHKLTIHHPTKQEPVTFEAPLPF
ncbi:pseudouridine synthase [Kordiimonas aquimaris]|uniref:pseudouridine synthase n=1 Tax=Kordiimonas aquimaris TaxID=707591 RepID=UPI0021D395FD|nr:pseudouridine synthase [Kordiimonas aquimaris]